MTALSAIDGMIEALGDATGAAAKPFLGICVGMQLMAEAGEEHGSMQALAGSGAGCGPGACDPDQNPPYGVERCFGRRAAPS